MRVAELAAGEWGVLSVEELAAVGLSRQAILVRVRNGRLHRVHRGVYAVGHATLAREARWLAAVKACGTHAVLSHRSAAELWGLLERTDRLPAVTVPERERREHAGIEVHQSARLERRDLTRRAQIPVTTPARTVLDLAAICGRRELRAAVRRGQASHLISLRRLVEVIDRLAPCRGVRKLRALLADGHVPTASELENIVFDLIADGGLVAPDVNKPIRVAGRWIKPDFRWPHERLIIEADGAAWHDQKLAREDDVERQALLEADGETVLRVTWRQAVGDRAATLRRIRLAGAPTAEPRIRQPQADRGSARRFGDA